MSRVVISPVQLSAVIEELTAVFEKHAFRVNNEAELQEQVALVLSDASLELRSVAKVSREVRGAGGRYDIMIEGLSPKAFRLILELKVQGTASEVERQAQRYALTAGIDAVLVVTTSQRLARQLLQPGAASLGGKPFRVIALRTTF